jgi:F-type H+-transporting ATPase subunit c
MVDGNLVEMGKLIGAGLACTGMGGAAIGVGHVVGNFLSGALRNPSAASGQTSTMFIGIAFAEALGIFSFLVALLLMYAM